MASSYADFYLGLINMLVGLPQVSSAEREQLVGEDVQASLSAADRVIKRLGSPTRLVIDIIPNDGGTDCRADRPVEVVELRKGHDLRNYGPEDMFNIDVDGVIQVAAGHHETILLAPRYVEAVFAAQGQHKAFFEWQQEVRRTSADDRRYRIEWLEGYDAAPPQEHPIGWFDPAGDKGFSVEDAKGILALATNGFAHEITGVTERVRITRIA